MCTVSEAADEETVSIDVMDVSDFDGDDNDICDEVPPSPRPPSHPRPHSQAAEQESPRVSSMGRRVHTRNQRDGINAVCSVLGRQFTFSLSVLFCTCQTAEF